MKPLTPYAMKYIRKSGVELVWDKKKKKFIIDNAKALKDFLKGINEDYYDTDVTSELRFVHSNTFLSK